MDQPRREQLNHLIEYLAEELIGRLDGRIERVVRISLHRTIAVRRFLPVRQFRIGDKSRRAVTGNIDLRHDFDIQRGRVGNDPAHVVLGVIARNRFGPVAKLRQKWCIRTTGRTHGGQQRIGLDFKTPCLVIRQVPMEPVHAQPCENIDEPHHIAGRIKLPRDIQMAAAPAVTRRIADAAGRREPEFGIDTRAMQQLRQNRQAILQTGSGRIFHNNRFSGKGETITFGFQPAMLFEMKRLSLMNRREAEGHVSHGKKPAEQGKHGFHRKNLFRACVFRREKRDRKALARFGIDFSRPWLDGERQVELSFREQHRSRLAVTPIQHQIADINGAMCAIGKADIGGFRPVGAMPRGPQEAIDGKAPGFPRFEHETGWRRKFMEIGIAAQINGIAANRLVHRPRQRRIDDAKILQRFTGKIDQRERKAAGCGLC
ncbi:hypothetical protein D3C80_807610 [compost metagenome]